MFVSNCGTSGFRRSDLEIVVQYHSGQSSSLFAIAAETSL
jgi:hypothetical protein